MKLHEKFRQAREDKGLTQKELGDLVGVSQVAVMKIENGQTKNPRKINDFARALGVNVDWLLYQDNEIREPTVHCSVETLPQSQNVKESSNIDTFIDLEPWDSRTPLDEDEVEVPFYMEVELSAGNGSAIQLETTGPKLRFSKSTLRRHGIDFSSAACVKVSGNSMEPVIPDGATVGIDTSNTNIKDGDMYAIDWAGALYVKTLTRRPGGGLRIRSFNLDEYPDENLSADEAQTVRVIGRVFWYSVLR
ncbi:S24 family peptidase [Pseudoalteromonas sp. MEBiC 03485]|uniref:XRE family transcriptional regulator n=1 Tax=Pseudoalteromonas sp. MEBiC 03485 TaxID=2571103 RepID=UPI001020E2F0|nr:S24 family peptidase [Pseudoalteromonas sp. MEBiC 03485]RZD22376.1 helix-turn-helix domain-containing protein [Pseudoalteromonas sp. MEBiC 03485]